MTDDGQLSTLVVDKDLVEYKHHNRETNKTTDNVKLCGYLKKKRSKVGGWRKMWFVLQDKLLLSYASKEEYDNKLVSFKDVLNLMPGTMVRPLSGHRFTIETSSNALYTFHCDDRHAYREWITMLLGSLTTQLPRLKTPAQRYYNSYSMDNLPLSSAPLVRTNMNQWQPSLPMTQSCEYIALNNAAIEKKNSNVEKTTTIAVDTTSTSPTPTSNCSSLQCNCCVRLVIAQNTAKILERNGGCVHILRSQQSLAKYKNNSTPLLCSSTTIPSPTSFLSSSSSSSSSSANCNNHKNIHNHIDGVNTKYNGNSNNNSGNNNDSMLQTLKVNASFEDYENIKYFQAKQQLKKPQLNQQQQQKQRDHCSGITNEITTTTNNSTGYNKCSACNINYNNDASHSKKLHTCEKKEARQERLPVSKFFSDEVTTTDTIISKLESVASYNENCHRNMELVTTAETVSGLIEKKEQMDSMKKQFKHLSLIDLSTIYNIEEEKEATNKRDSLPDFCTPHEIELNEQDGKSAAMGSTEPIYAIVDLKQKYTQRKKRNLAKYTQIKRSNSYDSILRRNGAVVVIENFERKNSISLNKSNDDIDAIYEDGDTFLCLNNNNNNHNYNLVKFKQEKYSGYDSNVLSSAESEEDCIYEPIEVRSAPKKTLWRYLKSLKLSPILQKKSQNIHEEKIDTLYESIQVPKYKVKSKKTPNSLMKIKSEKPVTTTTSTKNLNTLKHTFGTHRRSMQLRMRKLCSRGNDYLPKPFFKQRPQQEQSTHQQPPQHTNNQNKNHSSLYNSIVQKKPRRNSSPKNEQKLKLKKRYFGSLPHLQGKPRVAVLGMEAPTITT